MSKKSLFLCLFLVLCAARTRAHADAEFPPAPGPSVLVLYDGPDKPENPGRLDAFYLANLLGHFTTRRDIQSLDSYTAGEYRNYDAVFSIIYQRRYRVPAVFLRDVAVDTGTFCWLANQVQQLDQRGTLRDHGIEFIRFTDQVKLNQVFYKDRALEKGDPESNFLKIIDSDKAQAIALFSGPGHPDPLPYIIQSGNFWVVADSPFSYSSERDRYLVFADVLHDILVIHHAEQHPALLRIEDINASSNPIELDATLRVIRKHHIPFAFGFVPTYINPHERIDMRLSDRPEVVNALKEYVKAGGTPVLHGYTHQYRGVTADDYEFWDDLGDRPVRGDSEVFVERRLEEAIKESMYCGLYPVTWETPHYAASPLDYRVIHRYFETTYERRLATNHLDADQFFPYPVIDLHGQYVIPENLAYIEQDYQKSDMVLANARAAYVVRDGYASVFYHPFLPPELLDQVITGIEKIGFHFVDLKRFPNKVHFGGRFILTSGGTIEIAGKGRYLYERIFGPHGEERMSKSLEVQPEAVIKRSVQLREGETFVAWRQELPPPSLLKKLVQMAKGDISVFHRKWETAFPGRTPHDPVRTTVLWNPDAKGAEAIDQASFYEALHVLGFDIEQIDYSRLTEDALGPFALLVIPQATARLLPDDAVDRIVHAVNGGITVVTDGESPLSKGLGIQLGPPSPVSALQDNLFVEQNTHWPDHPVVPWIAHPTADESNVFYTDREQQHPLAISKSFGDGHYLYFAPLFDPISGQGYSRFPDFPEILINEMQITPLLRRRGADVYFDPGYRTNINIETLAKMWRRFGIRAVHASAWTYYDKWVYDYARLVRVCHQNGILVYAWFEWPEVSQRFWDRHPAWREKNAMLSDARVDWRYLMNLQDPQCLKTVLEDTRKFLNAYDWDGVDIGELTFESSLQGPANPQVFTPLNNQARGEFQRLRGFDPLELFRPSATHYWRKDPAGMEAFYAYRQDVNVRLLKTFLEALRQMGPKRHRDWEIIVTLLDVLQHPELGKAIAVDLPRTVDLINQYHATLQVEDPASEWQKPPSRYTELGKRYSELHLNSPFMIDINVLPVHPFNQTGFATERPTGTEMMQLWHAASEQAARVSIYSESSVLEQDWEVLPYAMASRASVRKDGDNWLINTPYTVALDVGHGARRYKLDGQPWFCADKGDVLIPPGEHTLSFARAPSSILDTAELQTRLAAITGELLGSQRINRGLELEYASPTRCALLFNKLPYHVDVDGKTLRGSAVRGDDGYTVLAPPGQHRLRVISESFGLYLVEFTSLVSASLIVLFGIASTGLLAVLFIFIWVHRRARRIGQFFKRLVEGKASR